ncbi:MAG: cation transporter [Firmicutes bacterium]|nr:cation transporter [Bacillota bacterium]
MGYMQETNYKKGERITTACVVGNVILSLFKLFAGLTGGSKAMVSDALHSGSDVVATLVVLIGIKIAKKPVDKEHPYGHGKIEPIAAAFVGVTLIFAAFAIVKGIIESIINHSFATPSFITIVAAVISIVVKEAMFRITYSEGKKINSVSIMANAWDHRSDAYSSIGTFFGILGSIIGNYFNIYFLEYLDPLAGAIVACLIFKVAFDILKHSIKGLMDSSPSSEKINSIKESVMGIDGVISISWIKARYMGQHLFVDMGIGVDPGITVEEGHNIAMLTKEKLLEDIKDVFEVLVHIDPVVNIQKNPVFNSYELENPTESE